MKLQQLVESKPSFAEGVHFVTAPQLKQLCDTCYVVKYYKPNGDIDDLIPLILLDVPPILTFEQKKQLLEMGGIIKNEEHTKLLIISLFGEEKFHLVNLMSLIRTFMKDSRNKTLSCFQPPIKSTITKAREKDLYMITLCKCSTWFEDVLEGWDSDF